MAALLSNLRNTVIAGFALTVALVVFVTVVTGNPFDPSFAYGQFITRWLHVISGVMWIGLLWYFNFVQAPSMPAIPDEQKPVIGKYIAPRALFWFRWAAKSTLVFGLLLAYQNGYLMDMLSIGAMDGFSNATHVTLGIGMWFGIIMWFNVWFVIWPNQKKVIGLVEADADAKAKAARTAMLFSRTNTLLSIPMLYAMVSAQQNI